jgi:hypothetical protein
MVHDLAASWRNGAANQGFINEPWYLLWRPSVNLPIERRNTDHRFM